MEPIIRFWLVARNLPAVQAWRLRSLSFGFGGLVAILMFALGASAFASNALGQILIQLEDIGGVFIYCAVATFIILKVIDMIVGLRVSKEVEVEGLDINLHGETVHG